MPTELRRITFNFDELVEAIAEYDKHASQKLTCGFIVDVEVSEEPLISAIVEIKVFGHSKNIKMKMDSREIGASIVMYCLNKNIPIPTNAVRYLKKSGKNISFFVSMGEAIQGPATVLPDYFDYDFLRADSKAA